MLDIRDLQVEVSGERILKGVNLTVNAGEIHAVMGPNGSGKSTLTHVIAGKPGYDVVQGEVIFEGIDLLELSPDQRAREGIFLAFQYPVELPGVRNRQLLKSALDAVRLHRGQEELSAREFDKLFKTKVKEIGMDAELMKRSVNEGFSGGEKKRSEILQLSMLDPKLALLDETDSGLDIDALKSISESINRRVSSDRSTLLVTHYQRILNYVQPDCVHVLVDGIIVESGGRELASELEASGYKSFKDKNIQE